jgi:hypothetical protein
LPGVHDNGGPRRAVPACTSPSAIVCENQRPGTPQRVWDVKGSGDPTIQGFATDISVERGETVHFKIDTPARRYHLDVYRLGYYGGDGARKVATVRPSARLPPRQPVCLTQVAPHVHLIDCGNWAESASWAVPRDAVSGVYFARLVRDDTQGASHVFFVVRDDTSHSALLFQTSDATWQAYNDYGGWGIYTQPNTAKASYNRPFTTRTAEGGHAVESWVLSAEYPMIRWLEANGYDVSYASSVDSDRYGAHLRDHRAVLSVGHDEYWSAGQRAAFTSARDAGVNLGFFSGNTSYWKTRWEPSIDGSHTAYRTLVTYKESIDDAKVDPSPLWTGMWRDPRFSPPADGGRPENALTGTQYGVYDVPAIPLRVSAADGRLRLWRNTALDRLRPGASLTLGGQTVGYEWDWDVQNDSRPAGVADYSTTDATPYAHHVTMYRAGSGALVFSAASVQWSWGLDAQHDGSWSGAPVPPADPRMRQATVNVLADLGAQPVTLQPGLVRAQPSTDDTPPSTTIAPTVGMRVVVGGRATVTGTATDRGGRVAAVDVSVDGGHTWRRATGRENWTYSWVPTTTGTPSIEARAVDDSANLGLPVVMAGPDVLARSCPCALWSTSLVPAKPDAGATGPHELGVKFESDVDGDVVGVRFYKSAANTGAHTGSLWSSTAQRLATAPFRHESASGWQTVTFDRPVPISARRVYVASYHTDTGHFAQDPLYFDDWYTSGTRGLDVPPLHALWARGPSGTNGVMKSGASGFPADPPPPSQYLDNANFWVDVIFTTTPPVGRVTTATGTVEDRNPATLAADQSVEGAEGPSLHHGSRFFRRAVEAAIALAILLVIIAVIVAIVVARRRPHRPAAM